MVQVKGTAVEANVPKGVTKDQVTSLAEVHDLAFRPALQTFPGGPNDDTTDPRCDAPGASPDKPCLTTSQADAGATLLLGPATVDGTAIDTAAASESTSSPGQWQVALSAKADKKADLNAVLDHCFAGDETCPKGTDPDHGRLAVVLDGTVLTIPTVTAKGLADSALVLSGDYTKDAAEKLATQLRLASVPLPVAVTAA